MAERSLAESSSSLRVWGGPLALVLLVLFAVSGKTTAVVVLACVALLASCLAIVFGLRGRKLA
jgi:hypothetical protein